MWSEKVKRSACAGHAAGVTDIVREDVGHVASKTQMWQRIKFFVIGRQQGIVCVCARCVWCVCLCVSKNFKIINGHVATTTHFWNKKLLTKIKYFEERSTVVVKVVSNKVKKVCKCWHKKSRNHRKKPCLQLSSNCNRQNYIITQNVQSFSSLDMKKDGWIEGSFNIDSIQ